MKLYSEWEL